MKRGICPWRRVFVCLMASMAGMNAAHAAEPAQDRTVLIDKSDGEMKAAIDHAQATLDEFLRLHAHPPTGASGFKLKVRIEDVHGVEHMWVLPFRQSGAGFTGILADEPDYVRSVKNGQRLDFQRDQISDWGYVQDGKQRGSFTVCVLFKRMPAAEVALYRRDYGFEC